MSSALDSPQSSNSNEALPKIKSRIRWRLMLAGLGLLAFGLALPFALNYYYSSSYSQEAGTSFKKIPPPAIREISAKLKFKKQKTRYENAGDSRHGDFALLPSSFKPDSFQNLKTLTVSLAEPSAAPQGKSAQQVKPTQRVKPEPQTRQTPQIRQTPLKVESLPVPAISLDKSILRKSCPPGAIPKSRASCGGEMTVKVTTKNTRSYDYDISGGRIEGQGEKIIWNLNGLEKGKYWITVNGNEKTRKTVEIIDCQCTTEPKPPTSDNITARLDKLFVELGNDPTSKAYILNSGTDAQIASRERQIENYLKLRRIDPSRVTIERAKGNSGDTATKIYIVPDGAENPNLIPANVNTNSLPTPTIAQANSGNTNVNVNAVSTNSDRDKFGFVYPSRFIKGTEYEICLSLQPESSAVKLCENTNSNTPVVTGGAMVPPVTKPGYDTFVTAQLKIGDGLQVTGNPEQMRLSYDRQSGDFPQWKWKLKLSEAGENSGTVEIQFNCDVELIPKQNSAAEKKQERWTSGALESRVGLPFASKIFTYLSTLTGGLAFIFSVVPVWGAKKEILKSNQDIVIPPISGQTLEDEVHCTLYAPGKARAGESFVIQIFAHLIEQAEGLEALAKALDEETRKHVAEKLKRKIKRGSTLTFKLTMPGLDVTEAEEFAEWEGEPVEVQFIVAVPDNHASGKRFGKVSVYENNEKIGTITFGIEILAREAAAQTPPPLPPVPTLPPVSMSRKESAFVSYASEDKAEVYDFLRLLDSMGVEYHVDIVNIAPGDRWEQKLYEFIDADDVFLLFWSKNASHSEWVIKEAERAHLKTGSERKNPPKIVIFHLETPPEAELPEWLRDIHYDRKWSQLSENARRQN